MTDNKIVLRSMDEVEKAATAMAKSGYFTDAKDAAQAVVKILAGREMGFGPFASMTGIYIIQGRPAIGANLMAAAVKSSGKYDYRVIEMTDAVCELEYFQSGKTIGKSRFTKEDAAKAGTKNLDKFPRNMLFARAMSNGCRWYCPDIFAGAPTYTPEEMGATVNEAGDVIDVPAQPVPPTPATTPGQPTICTPEYHAWLQSHWPTDAAVSFDLAKMVKTTATKSGVQYLYFDLSDADLSKHTIGLAAKLNDAEHPLDEMTASETKLKMAVANLILQVRDTK